MTRPEKFSNKITSDIYFTDEAVVVQFSDCKITFVDDDGDLKMIANKFSSKYCLNVLLLKLILCIVSFSLKIEAYSLIWN